MTSAAKWKEFLRWWEDNRERRDYFIRSTLISMIDTKIEELQKNNNAKQ